MLVSHRARVRFSQAELESIIIMNGKTTDAQEPSREYVPFPFPHSLLPQVHRKEMEKK